MTEASSLARAVHDALARSQDIKALYDGECRGCGECCSRFLPLTVADRVRIGQYVLSNNVRQRPEPDGTVDLTCPYLTEKRECAIYDARPQICSAFRCDLYVSKDYGPLEQLSWKTAKLCDMREEFGGVKEAM